MKKYTKYLKIAGYVLLALIVSICAAYPFRNKLIVTAVETFVPKVTKTAVSLESVDFRPFSGSISVKNLKIANPKGFSAPYIFTLGKIDVNLKLASLTGKKIIIKNILVDKVAVTYELLTDGTSNIEVIQKNAAGEAKASEEKSAKKDDKKSAKSQKPAKTVVIKKLRLQGAEVSAVIAGIPMKLPLPPVTLTDIGENKPSTAAEVFSQIMNVFSKETLSAITQATTKALKEGASSLKDVFKKLF